MHHHIAKETPLKHMNKDIGHTLQLGKLKTIHQADVFFASPLFFTFASKRFSPS
jgi:hypothetical protein